MPVLRLSMLLQIFSLQKDVIPCKPVNYITYIIQEILGFENKLNTPSEIEPPKNHFKADFASLRITIKILQQNSN